MVGLAIKGFVKEVVGYVSVIPGKRVDKLMFVGVFL